MSLTQRRIILSSEASVELEGSWMTSVCPSSPHRHFTSTYTMSPNTKILEYCLYKEGMVIELHSPWKPSDTVVEGSTAQT